ncbi:MAG: beta-phosphoglucomutase family hydrolase [Akkermansia sp.]|nr:beta-phosphoglucomutase family hydrolase [Akkermansia sp.]
MNCGAMSNRVDLPEKKYDGYIFDLDGTLVDSMPLHFKAWRKALLEAGAPESVFQADEFYSCGGKSATDVVKFLNERYGLIMDAEATAANKRAIYLELLQTEGMQPIKEVMDFVYSLGDAPKAIATGSALPGACSTLKSAGLEGVFELILTPDDVKHGKPAPDMFLLAAEKLGVDPTKCVVFEDALPGMTAAAAAGMDCVVVKRPELS